MTTNPVPSDTDRLAEIRARLDAATPGPWQDAGDVSGIETASGERITIGDDSGYGCVYIDDGDRDLLANAPADLTYLLDVAEDCEARLAAKQHLVDSLQGRLDTAEGQLDGWLLAPHHDTGGEYGLYHDCAVDEAAIGIGERSLRGVLDEVREHECVKGTDDV
ncbi:hypothetical protein [Glycomyces paridis]|uniref:Uncharacterized protein n=1 Tax=Glycomyces paridis TaxID=2126555 RepID=A0A4V4HNG3_9ACTN|nr:hypothetical protein [Glycomyces paridis]THV25986.1 hypothetical protein E9998_19830 [Glycomyces paridis]